MVYISGMSKKKPIKPELKRECDALKAIWNSKKKQLGLKHAIVGGIVDISDAAVSHYLNGVNPLNADIAVVFSKVIQEPVSKFSPRLAKDIEKYSAAKESDDLGITEPPGSYTPRFSIPLISEVNAGSWCESPDNYAPGDAEEWLPAPTNAGPRTFALRVVNDSMTSPYPGQRSYPHGMIIYVDPDKEVINGSRVVARANGDYTFKSYIEDAGRKYLKPINPTYEKIDITDDVHICGVVIGSYLPE